MVLQTLGETLGEKSVRNPRGGDCEPGIIRLLCQCLSFETNPTEFQSDDWNLLVLRAGSSLLRCMEPI